MKISLWQLCLALIFAGIACATDIRGQEMLEKRVSLRIQDQSLKAVLSNLESKADVKFMYSPKVIQARQLVSLQVTNVPLQEALNQLLKPLNIHYRVAGSRIVLSQSVAPLAIPSLLPNAEAPVDISITGTVTDENGAVLPGVSILIKGTQRGTVTNAKGVYALSVPDKNATLIFSYVGYMAREELVANRTQINVSMQVDDRSLSEVVVVGYGTQKKENLTGAVSTIDSKSIENRPVSNVANAMQGLASGLSVTRQSGQPGDEGISIQVRGASSANGNVDPLVLLDGVTVPIFTLQTMNPNDIESISVLKDAAAASIYGAQAAGGVILITSKKGRSGKTVFDYSGQYGVDWALNIPERMSLLDEALYSNDARKNAGQGPEYNDTDLQRIRDGIQYIINPTDTNSYIFYNSVPLPKQILRDYTQMQTHNLSARGGTDKMNFLISLGYYSKQGVFKVGPDQNNRYNVRLNLGTQLTRHLSLDSRITYTLQKQEASSQGIGGDGTSNGGGIMYQILRLRTRQPFLTPEGRYNAGQNTLGRLEAGGYNNIDRNFLDGVFTFRLANFIKGFQLKAVVGKTYRRNDQDIFYRTVESWSRTRVTNLYQSPNGYQVTNDFTNNTNIQLLADYDFSIQKNHKFHLLGGYQWEEGYFKQVTTRTNGLVNNDVPALGLGDDRTKTNSQNVQAYALQSFFGRFNYSYADRFLLEATFRVDESSRLAPGLRVKTFPSISAGWNLHRENWFNTALPVFSEFKIRGSWGRLGNASGIGNYDYLSLLTRGANVVLGAPEVRNSYFSLNTIPSTNLSWETIETSNGGIDLGLFKNRLQFSADYYVKFNRNMLTPLQLPATFGFGTPKINNGELKSWGWDVDLKYRDKIGKDFTYSVVINVSDNQNKLLSYAGNRVIASGINRIIEGYPINTIWGYRTDGYFATSDEVKASAFQDTRTGPGDVRYLDLNGDGRITVGQGKTTAHGDLVYLGTADPRYLFGATLSMAWKGLDFSVFFQGVGKRNYLPYSESIQPLAQAWKQALSIHSDYWTLENQDALFPRPYFQGAHNFLAADKWVLNGRYIRLKNIQIGYTLPDALLKKMHISRARFFVTGQDILTFSGLGAFQGYFDPESRNNVNNDYPYFATAAVGLNLSF